MCPRFNTRKPCSFGEKCWHKHICSICFRAGHSRWECREKKEGKREERNDREPGVLKKPRPSPREPEKEKEGKRKNSCSGCGGKDIPPMAKFCPFCGLPRCGHCGNTVTPRDAKFCPHCGKTV